MFTTTSTLRGQSVTLAGGELTSLLFVHEVSLVATGYDRAECLLGLLEAYCEATGMAVNAAKCEVLIFLGATRERKRLMEAEYRLGITGAKACRYMNWMGAAPPRGARLVWLEHTKVTMPQRLHQVLMCFRLCDCGAVEDELHIFYECPAYKSIRAKYDGDLVFKGRSMCTIVMTEALPLAFASLRRVRRHRLPAYRPQAPAAAGPIAGNSGRLQRNGSWVGLKQRRQDHVRQTHNGKAQKPTTTGEFPLGSPTGESPPTPTRRPTNKY
ncbi:hypothetical protein VOLCADRAFT_91955 [Volvox carteri f. nagariensis]|uniref:Uncharacterized protein n=1 Tax=Volvox carteri f. nagariensis TaxID=3068 RepID=D8TYE3_VOLCA|nr:uncharacterized protein VOLCADRAFT_91955 [Volvox carteri f. nagariensis]EFJ47625.1 hypothetical protein VOLCADRAFT_91955 [Volvox carteri f. nagariensis]|eukprot:XP_002951449.1 hypothetical protein VOLCADRAFT_91955 [Volvox carteri f. nagariensis]